MTLAPKDYIAARRQELRQQIQLLDDELRLLDRMESALPGQPAVYNGPEFDLAPTKRRQFEKSIKEMVLEVLRANDMAPMSALDILDAIKTRFGADIERTSLSPQLSRLKNDGLIAARNNAWAITMLGVATYAPEA